MHNASWTCDEGLTHTTGDRVGIERQSVSMLDVSDVLTLRTVPAISYRTAEHTHAWTNPQSSPHCCSRLCKLIRNAELPILAILLLLTESQLRKSRSNYCDDRKKGNPWSFKVNVWKGMSEIMTMEYIKPYMQYLDVYSGMLLIFFKL